MGCTMFSGEFEVFGLDNHEQEMKEVFNLLKTEKCKFELKLIINELLSNAFYHGNKGDKNTPINVRYIISNDKVELEVKDGGTGLSKVNIPRELDDDDLLKESGRGLYLVQCFTDEVHLDEGKIKIVKKIS